MMIDKKKVLTTLQKCMNNLTGGSGHLASFSIINDSFNIEKESYEGELCKVNFTAVGIYETEFLHVNETRENLAGSIYLKSDYTPAFDEEGRVMLSPWHCILKPEHFKQKAKKVSTAPPLSSEENILSQEEVDYLLNDLD